MHYKNGREAKVGDPVVGKGYNKGMVAGTLVSITPGAESCNCMIALVGLKPLDDPLAQAQTNIIGIRGSYNHGSLGTKNLLYPDFEYSQCSNLLHAEDAMGEGEERGQ